MDMCIYIYIYTYIYIYIYTYVYRVGVLSFGICSSRLGLWVERVEVFGP